MLHKSQFVEFLHDDQQEEESPSCSTPENAANSPPLSVDDDDINLQLPKKRRGAHKKVVTVTIGGGDDPRSKAEIHPPKDSWSWRKYGQKPIKGSPYPRGYYRCSSSKGCPAKKQVERSFHDPNILLITYSGDHSHSQSTTTKLNHHIDHHSTATPVKPIPVTSNAASSSSNASDINVPSTLSQEETLMVAPDINNFSEMTGGELGWFPSSSDMGTTLLDNAALVGPASASASDHWDDDVDVNIMLPFGEEDQSLFGDLGELPESSAVFRRGIMEKT